MRALAILAAALAVAGCSRTEQVPGVVVEVVSDLIVPDQLDSVELQVRVPSSATEVVKQRFSLDPGVAAHAQLPLHFGLYPREGKGGRFTVSAVGKRGDDEVVWRSASLSFPTSGPTVLLQLPLLAVCNGRRCGTGETCAGPTICRSDEILVAELPPYRRGGNGVIDGQPDAAAPKADGPARDTGPSLADATLDRSPPNDATTDLPADGPAPDLAPDLGVDVGPACVPATEACFNGLDDDCDQQIDCADPDCVPDLAQCVPADPAENGTPGVSVAANASCPPLYNTATATTLRTGPSGAPCGGCMCAPGPVTCGPATIFTYVSAAACNADTTNTAGDPIMPPTLTAAEGCKTPSYTTAPAGLIHGVRVAPIAATMGGCTPAGMAAPGPITWATTMKFCPTVLRGAGCPAGQFCVPRPPGTPAPRVCVSYPSARACPAGTTRLQNADWFTGATDNRSCGPCACGAPTGGSCAPLYVHVGNDHECTPNNGDVGAGRKLCSATAYWPGLQVHGTPTPGTCAASSNTAGAIMPTGRRSVCCQ